MGADILSLRALNRATLARQLLLRRADLRPLAAIEHLVGLQAQEPRDPYLALWSRLDGFDPDGLSQLLAERQVVRIVAMRATLHLLTADDCLVLRPLSQPVLDRELTIHREVAPALVGVDLDPVLTYAREILAEPHTPAQLRSRFAERFPEHDAAALAYACRNRLALVQIPPRGLWRGRGQVVVTTAESWLGRPLSDEPSLDDVVMRYLAAFGPATTADVATWSRLTGLAPVIERLRPKLRPFLDERGRELVDLPDAPRPDPDTPAPPRFLPEYDNVLLSHADRSRFVADDDRKRLAAVERPAKGSVLVDGTVFGTWLTRAGDDGRVTLEVRHLGRPTKAARADVTTEGHAMMRLLHPDVDVDLRLVPVD